MDKLSNRFELRLSDEHSRRLKAIMEAKKDSSKADTIRALIERAYNEGV